MFVADVVVMNYLTSFGEMFGVFHVFRSLGLSVLYYMVTAGGAERTPLDRRLLSLICAKRCVFMFSRHSFRRAKRDVMCVFYRESSFRALPLLPSNDQ